MTIVDYEYEAWQRRYRGQLKRLRRTVHRWRVAAIAFSVLFALCACALFALLAGKAQAAPVSEQIEGEYVEVVEAVEAAEEIEDSPICHLEAISFYPVPLDHDLQAHIIRTCNDYGIDPAIVMAVIRKESTFNESAVGDGGNSAGLMQIQERWHRERMERLGASDLLDPYQNTEVGIDYLAELISYDKGMDWALAAYNAGITGANNGIGFGYAEEIMASHSNLNGGEA